MNIGILVKSCFVAGALTLGFGTGCTYKDEAKPIVILQQVDGGSSPASDSSRTAGLDSGSFDGSVRDSGYDAGSQDVGTSPISNDLVEDGGYDADAGSTSSPTCIEYTGYPDRDNDGFTRPLEIICELERPEWLKTAYSATADCDDSNESVWQTMFAYNDNDDDRFGAGDLIELCTNGTLFPGKVLIDGDCNDADSTVHPFAYEMCDGNDNDCDPTTVDGSGQVMPLNSLQAGVCLGSQQTCRDGSLYNDYSSVAGYEANERSCDGQDNDCDGSKDENLKTGYFLDDDGDRFGDTTNITLACAVPEGYASTSGDCNDNNREINPDAQDVCNSVNDDCDEEVDEDDLCEKIAFVSRREGDEEIYVVNADGSNLKNLTENLFLDVDPSWSPDGNRIAFISERGEVDDIYVMNADGSNPQRITNNSYVQYTHFSNPHWSPDGNKLLFLLSTGQGMDFYTINYDGSDLQRLTDDSNYKHNSVWSPDGGMIAAFFSSSDRYEDVYVMNADGANRRRLTSQTRHDNCENLDWSPDGTKIIYSCELEDDGGESIYTVTVDEGIETMLLGSGRAPSFSPDGTKIVYVYPGEHHYWDVHVMDADGSNPQNLTNTPVNCFNPSWSPSGAKITYGSWVGRSNQDVYVIDVDGNNLRNLTNTPEDRDYDPVWSH